MKTKIILLLVTIIGILFLAELSHAQTDDNDVSDELLSKIKALKGVYVKRIEPLPGFSESFEMAIVQPVDHKNPKGLKFTQRIFLAHKSYTKPVVVETDGYGVTRQKQKELSKLLDANQILVEHRYFDASKPKPLDWKYLTVEQAASDHHRIIELFKNIYNETSVKWITTGRSKGGMAALFHKYYFPGDVDATVAFVAPIMIGLEDIRFLRFLEQMGESYVGKEIKDFQIAVLKRRSDLFPAFLKYVDESKIKFTLDPEIVFEYAVVQYPYSFYQGKVDHSSIPRKDASTAELFKHLAHVVSFNYYSESGLKRDAALIYQAVTEFGYHGFPKEHLQGMLTVLPEPKYSIFAPPNTDLVFKPEVMKNILDYLQNRGDRIIYLYGETDPWTACAVEPKQGINSFKYVVPGLSHNFTVNNLTVQDKEQFYSKLEAWLDIKLDRN